MATRRARTSPGTSRSRRRHGAVAVAALAAFALLATACSSSKGGGGAATSGSGSKAPALSGDPVVIGIIGDDTGTAVQNPSGGQLARIAALDVNAHGGIHGRPLKVMTCDDKSDAQDALVCARQLLQDDHAVMLAGVYSSTQGASIYPALDQANTISLGNYAGTPADQQNPRSYPVLPGSASTIGLVKAVPAGATKVAVVHFPTVASTAAANALIAGLPAGTTGFHEQVQTTTVDYQPTCLDLKSKGAQAVASFLAAGPALQLITTCKQVGLNVSWLIPSITLDPAAISGISTLGVKNSIVVGYAGPAYQQMLDDVSKYSSQVGGKPANTVGDIVIAAWLGVILAGKVLNAVSKIDGPTIKAYLDSQTNFETGLTPPIDFSKPGPIAADPRIFNTTVAIGTLKDGALSVDPKSFVSFAK